jgi:hypothetical protein
VADSFLRVKSWKSVLGTLRLVRIQTRKVDGNMVTFRAAYDIASQETKLLLGGKLMPVYGAL